MVQPEVHTFWFRGVNGVFENKPETNNFDRGSCVDSGGDVSLVPLGE
jgi:hypothetical protein